MCDVDVVDRGTPQYFRIAPDVRGGGSADEVVVVQWVVVAVAGVEAVGLCCSQTCVSILSQDSVSSALLEQIRTSSSCLVTITNPCCCIPPMGNGVGLSSANSENNTVPLAVVLEGVE